MNKLIMILILLTLVVSAIFYISEYNNEGEASKTNLVTQSLPNQTVVKQEKKYIKNIKNSKVTIENDEMVIYRTKDNEVQIYSFLPDDNILITVFERKAWGTWNIGGWYIAKDKKIPSKNYYLIAGGHSDWEYALRVRKDLKKKYGFSGGSHGKEYMKTLKLLNPDDDSNIWVKKGDFKIVKQLKIEEKTFLTTTPEYNTKYAEVERTYIVSPAEISLKSNFKFTSNVFMGTSYVCMLPMPKEYGRYVWFEGTLDFVTTPKKGETVANTNIENYYGKEKSTEVRVWGDTNPAYVFEVSILNKDMVDNFKNSLKTFYWDINKDANKLYFSKFETDQDEKINKGTEWENYSEWKLHVAPEALAMK